MDAGSLLRQQRPDERPPQPAAPTVLPRPAPEPGQPTEAPPSEPRRLTVKSFRVQGNQLIDSEALLAALTPWTGRPLTLDQLREAPRRLQGLYREQGRLASVSIPPQDVTEGVVTLNIVEAQAGQPVVVEAPAAQSPVPVGAGAKQRVTEILTHAMPAGKPIDLNAMERALAIADEMPGLGATGGLRAGQQTGTTDLVATLSGTRRYRAEATLDNHGARAVGTNRLLGLLVVDSPLGYGEQFQVDGSLMRGSQYVHLGANAPIAWGGWRGWRAGLDVSAMQYKVLDRFNTTTGLAPRGTSQTVGGRLSYPIVRTPWQALSFTTGIEQRWLRNEDDNTIAGQYARTLGADIRAGHAELAGTRLDQGGGGTTSGRIRFTLGQLDLDRSDPQLRASDAATTHSAGGYGKLNVSLNRQNRLPWQGSTLHLSLDGQYANRNLDASERIYLGGPYAVRAYPVGEAGGSRGLIASAELRKAWTQTFSTGVFYDWGMIDLYADNHRADNGGALVADNSVSLRGYGLSIVWRPLSQVEVRAVWAHRAGDNPLATPAGTDTDGSLRRNRFWLGTTIGF